MRPVTEPISNKNLLLLSGCGCDASSSPNVVITYTYVGSCDKCGDCKDVFGKSGGEGTTVNTYEFPNKEEYLIFEWDAQSIPDSFTVKFCGNVVVDTGPVSWTGKRCLTKPAGCTTVEVTVVGPVGTAWTYSIKCGRCTTETPTPPPSGTPTPTPDPSGTPTPTPDPSGTPTPTPDPSGTPTPTPDPSGTPTPTPDPSGTPTPTPDPSGTPTPTPDPSGTPTPTPNPSGTPTPTPDPSGTPTPTPDPSGTPTPTPDPSSTPTLTPTPDPSGTPTPTPNPTDTPTPTKTPPPTARPSPPVAKIINIINKKLNKSRGRTDEIDQLIKDLDHNVQELTPENLSFSQNMSGPGTQLKSLLKLIGIVASPTCPCNAKAKIMDDWGVDECEKRIPEILDWLEKEARSRKLPFIKFAAEKIVKLAINRARKNTKK